MFSHEDPANNPDIKQGETNDNPFQAFKIGSNYFKSCSGFLKIFALVINVVVFVCIFLPSSSNIKDCRFIASAAFGPGFEQYVLDNFNEKIPCEDFPSMTKKLDYESNKKACDTYGSLDKYASSKFEEVFANMTVAISKVGPFKTWILTPASSVWIQLVSLNGMFVTGLLLFFYLFKFSKIPLNFFEMAFCCAMSFCYFTCGLHLFIKGSEFTNQVTKCLFPTMDYFLTFGTAGFCFLGVFIYGIDGILKLGKWKKWSCTSSEVKYQDQINEI